MSIDVTDYASGASFQGGELLVTNTGVVGNLNASFLQNKIPSDFLQLGNDFGINQTKDQGRNIISANVIDMNMASSAMSLDNSHISLNASSDIRIGNLLIQSSNDGNGILIGTV